MIRPYTLDIHALVKVNAAIRDKPPSYVLERANHGHLDKIVRVADSLCVRYPNPVVAAATYAVCLPRFKPFDMCNRRTAGISIILVLNCNGLDLELDLDNYEKLLDYICQKNSRIGDVVIELSRLSKSLKY